MNKRNVIFIIFLGLFIIFYRRPVSAKIEVTPESATTGMPPIDVYVDTAGATCKVKYTVTEDFPSISSMWNIPGGNTTQTFASEGIWYLHIYNTQTGEIRTTGPYIREIAPPNPPTITSSGVGGWNNQDVYIHIGSNGDNGSTGYDSANNLNSSFTAGVLENQRSYDNAIWYGLDDFIVATEGWHTIYARTIDKVYNISSVTSTSFGIDKTPPSGVFNPNSCSWTNSDMTINFNPSDSGGSGVKQWRYRTSSNNGSSYGTWSGFIQGDNAGNINLTSQGQWLIQVDVYDNADNENTVTSGSYLIDKTPPSGIYTPNSSSLSILSQNVNFNPSDTGGSDVYRWRYRTSSNNGSSYGAWSNYIWGDTSDDILLNTISSNNKIQAEVTDGAGNINIITSGTYNIVLPIPINGKLEMKKFDFQEYNDLNGNGLKDSSEPLKPIYWVRPESGFKIYTDGYFPSNYGIYPTTTYVLYAKDGIINTGTSARQFADQYGAESYGSEYDKYFNFTDWGNGATFYKDTLNNRNYISHIHSAEALNHGDKFKLFFTNSYTYDYTEYYSSYVDSGNWLKVDGKAPTGNGLIDLDDKTLDMTITASNVTDPDSGIGAGSVWAMIYPLEGDNDITPDINDFNGNTEYKNSDKMKKKLIRQSDGLYKLNLNAYDDAFKSEKVKVVIGAIDNVGNIGILKDETVDLFTLKARIVPKNNMDYNSDTPPTLKRGQAGVLIMEVTGGAESLDIEYQELDALDNTLDKTITINPVENYKIENDNFIVPLYCDEKKYKVKVVAHRGNSTREAYPEMIVSDSILNGIRTRVR